MPALSIPVSEAMVEKLDVLERRYEELSQLAGRPDVVGNVARLEEISRELSSLEPVVRRYRDCRTVSRALDQTRALVSDSAEPEMRALAQEEVGKLQERLERLLRGLREQLRPQDPNDKRDVILEIRAATGGGEASLFAADLFRMYSRYAQSRGWQVDMIDMNQSGVGGVKEVTFEVKGRGVFSRLKYERGVHRVQRVPVTEASGRIHTSTVTVAVLPEADDVELDIKPEDLKVDIFHSSGAGGQNVNKVATAVRVTHLPTGMVAVCQDERSQSRNRQKVMAVIRARLLDRQMSQRQAAATQERRQQVGTGERAEKIRTYNFPQDRVTDHRIGLSLHNLSRLLDGGL
ncbi:MAG: peptide chain release factor 1, partial [Chloroflexota bacterium]